MFQLDVVGLAIGFGAQGLVSDVVTGFFLLLEKPLLVFHGKLEWKYEDTS